MLRVLLTLVLTMLVALPHGVCFCPHASASEHEVSACCVPTDDVETPTAPDDDDHDEHDCSCKLIEFLARDADPVNVVPDLDADFLGSDPIHAASDHLAGDLAITSVDASAGPLPLILCALRI